MRANRREIMLGFLSSFIVFPSPSQAKSSTAVWIEVVKVLGDVGESLASFSDSVGKIADGVVSGHDRLKRRAVRAALIKTSVKLTSLIADQQRVQPALDRYGELWRRFHVRGRKLSPNDQAALDLQWRASVAIIKSIAGSTTAVLADIRAFDSDIVLDDAYVRLQEALSAKVGVLSDLARMLPPSNPNQLKQLVQQEETFLHLRAEARGALESVNQAIKAIRT